MTAAPDLLANKRLTVAMIVRDAADLLRQTLDSIRPLADEIVILDTGSTDRSLDIAREEGARVFRSTWRDDFSAARNECATHIQGEWVLWLDAGESIDNIAVQQLRTFLRDSAMPSKAYLLFVCKPPLGITTAGEQIGQLRLMPAAATLRFEGRVRESALRSVQAAGLQIDALHCRILRPSVSLDPRYQRARAERNLRLIDLSFAEGDTAPLLKNLRAEALTELQSLDEAASVYREVIASAPRGSTEMLEAYYGLLTILDDRPQERDNQLALCLEALEVFPLDAQLLCGMGCYLLRQQRIDLAARSYELAATHGQIDPATWHLADLEDVATSCLSLARQLLGESAEAEQVLERALESRPDSIRLRRQLIEMCIKAGRSEDALRHVDNLPDDMPGWDGFRSAVSGALLAGRGETKSGLEELESAYEAGCRDPICLRWLATAQTESGAAEAAMTILREWQRLEPQSLEIEQLRQTLLRRVKNGYLAGGPHTKPAIVSTGEGNSHRPPATV